MSSSDAGTVLIVGAEPAAFSCAFTLIDRGLRVVHAYLEPLGLQGAARDIGLAFPELGEPWERLSYALGPDLANEYLQWSKRGIEDLEKRVPSLVTRGSRLSVTRTEQESELLVSDAIDRSKPPVCDEVRLMSGAAASNYAPIDGAHQCAFETHALSFVPIEVLSALASALREQPLYRSVSIDDADLWSRAALSSGSESVRLMSPSRELARGDICVVASVTDTKHLVNKFHDVLFSVVGQAFRTPPLREDYRSSVQGVTASWGYERYRFDQHRRLIGCGIDPSSGVTIGEEAAVKPKALDKLLKRAAQLFTDFDGSDEGMMKWAVEFTGSCDGLPLLGPLPGDPRIQILTAFFTSAWSRGWEAGRQMAMAISRSDEAELSPLLSRCTTRRFG